jgi:branched-chain amino acid transport system ATP-binding protein
MAASLQRPRHTLGRGVIPIDGFVQPLEGRQARLDAVRALVAGRPHLEIEGLSAGYGRMEILHDFDLAVGRGQSLCIIGPNGAGKSTVLQALFGFADIFAGRVRLGGREVTTLSPSEKLKTAGIAYVMQHPSVFPEMTVEENLVMGGYAMAAPARAAAERVLEKQPRLAARRRHRAQVLSGGERRLLEICRALIMDPDVRLVDEPSIGLEPRFIDMVFELLAELQAVEGKTIVLVEQNAKKGLEFADIGYVLVAGELAMAGRGDDLLADPKVGRLFLGG